MLRVRILHRLLLLSAFGAAATSCGDLVRQGRSPVYLIVDSISGLAGGATGDPSAMLISDVIVRKTTPDPCTVANPCLSNFDDFGEVTIRIAPKDPSVAPTVNNQVTITRYHVAFRRTDGRNTPGADVPYDFDGAVTATIQTAAVAVRFELVRHSAKDEAPLKQLRVNGDIINTIAEVTFYGKDQVGNDISVTGSISVNFADFADKSN